MELNISQSKTPVRKVNCKNRELIKFQNIQNFQKTNDFAYLGAIQTTDRGADKCMESRLSKDKTAFRKLEKVWSSKQFNKATKIKLFNTLVKPVLLYGSETWKTNVKDYERLDSFQYQCLKKILGIF